MEIKRCYDTIVGASVGENQLYGKTGNSTSKGITFTNVDGKITVSGVNDGTGTSYYVYNFTSNIPANHVVAFRSSVNGGSATTYDAQLVADGGLNEISYDGKSYIVTKKNYPWKGCNLNVRTGYNADQNPITFAPEIIDLTQKFGSSIADYIYSLESTTAGSGIAKLREWGFCTGYVPYNAGSIESVEVTGKKVVGFNQWDEETESGSYNQNGEPTTDSTRIRTKNPIHVKPNTPYYFKASVTLGIRWYDDQDNFISGIAASSNVSLLSPSNAYYLRFSIVNTTTYNHDICINLSSSRNGEYEAYSAQEYDYGTDTLNGIFKLDANNQLYADGDVKTSDGTITRYYGTRAYQSGDESLADTITDGTTTVYKLTTPTTEQGDPFPSPQVCYPDGTEEYVTSNGVPVGHETRYEL